VGNHRLYPEADALQRPLRSRFRARFRPGVIRTDRARGVGDRTLVADDPWARGEMS